MPNPVAVNDLSPISGSLQTSRISYGVETAGKDYGQDYNGTTWYSDIPNNGQFYTIISDNYTANYYVSRSNAGGAYVEGGLPAVDEYSAPVFWITAGTSSLDVITIVNGLPDRIGQTPFNSGSQALNWVASSSNYFAVGPDYYPQIDADALMFAVEGNQIISYPTTGSTWYDISGYNLNSSARNVTLYNSPTWNSNGWFTFDGTDDYGLVGVIPQASSSYVSITALVQRGTDGWNGALFGFGTADTSTQDVYFWGGDASRQFGFNTWNGDSWGFSNSTTTGNIMDGRWHHLTAIFDRNTITNSSIYVDGVLKSLSQVRGTTLTRTVSGNFGIGLNGWNTGDQLFRGNMSNLQMYPKALTSAEVAQNYYGGLIVTSSLYSMLDAGNLVSYPRTGTTAYTLTGSVNGTLTNGPSFTPAFGGGWVMDGVDDYLDTAVNSNTITPTNNWTVNIWCSLNSYPTISGTPKEGILFGQAVYGGLGIYAISSATGTVNVYGYFRSDTAVDLFGSYVWTLNTPTMFTLTYEVGVGCKFYVNGQLNATSSGTGGSWPSYMSLPFTLLSPQNGVYGGGSNIYIYYPITTYSTQVYNNKALTSAEVLQNYNATK